MLSKILFATALLHLIAFIVWCTLPVPHEWKPTGNFIADNIVTPIGAITLVILLVVSLFQPFFQRAVKKWISG